MSLRLTGLLASTALCNVAPAQTTLLVGPGGFADIGAAIAAASPGDFVVVAGGGYPPFTLNKGLTITAAPGAIVRIGNVGLALATTRFVIPSGQQALVEGIEFRNQLIFGYTQVVTVDGSEIEFSDCLFEGQAYLPDAVLTIRDSDVVMHRCNVAGGGRLRVNQSGAGGDGLRLERSRLAATLTTFAGGHLHWDFIGKGGDAILAVDSQVQLSHCIATGGNNDFISPGWPPGNGMVVHPTSAVWLADCIVLGGHGNAGAGATALVNLSPIPVELARTTLGGGSGSPAGSASTGAVVTAPLLGAYSSGSFVRGNGWQATFAAPPSTPIIALAAPLLAPGADPRIAQPIWFPPGSTPAFAGVTDGTGRAVFATAVPNDPALLHRSAWLSAFAGTALPLEGAPPLGGVVR
ncbi:MAG: hypothetical protein KDE27_00405 [Planctomycetes bacterium]|nr:hypothetical protein [Planctomycetota bacterium]